MGHSRSGAFSPYRRWAVPGGVPVCRFGQAVIDEGWDKGAENKLPMKKQRNGMKLRPVPRLVICLAETVFRLQAATRRRPGSALWTTGETGAVGLWMKYPAAGVRIPLDRPRQHRDVVVGTLWGQKGVNHRIPTGFPQSVGAGLQWFSRIVPQLWRNVDNFYPQVAGSLVEKLSPSLKAFDQCVRH